MGYILSKIVPFSEGLPDQPRPEQGDPHGHLQRRMQEDLRQEEDHRLHHLRQERQQQRGRHLPGEHYLETRKKARPIGCVSPAPFGHPYPQIYTAQYSRARIIVARIIVQPAYLINFWPVPLIK